VERAWSSFRVVGAVESSITPAPKTHRSRADEFSANRRSKFENVSATAGFLTPTELQLLERARGGDERAYGELVGPHRAVLHAHCYRMLGSLDDADDALQDALLRAWRGLGRFQLRSSLRTWLFRIATNSSLQLIGRRQRRLLPRDHGLPAAPHTPPGEPLADSVWIEPYPDELLASDAAPAAQYELRESVELAFVATLQHLPPLQRAVLLLRDVLDFSAREVADLLDTTVASVNSALQRARHTADERIPQPSQQATLSSLGDDAARRLVAQYADAIERADVDGLVSLLTEDIVWAMPPLQTWYDGREAVVPFLTGYPLTQRWRHIPTRANGQLALGCYIWDADAGHFAADVIDVLTLRDGLIAEVTAFIDPRLFPRFGLPDRVPP
jgi:RNA polymerase sigma-70 factor, ECF subfamily